MNEARPGHTPMTHVVVLIRVGLAFQSLLRHPFIPKVIIVLRHDDLWRASAFARLKAKLELV